MFSILPSLSVSKVDLQCAKNNEAHRTHEISVARLIVRRGTPFLLSFHLNRKFEPTVDELVLTVGTGPLPSEAQRTKSTFRVSQKDSSEKSWAAKVVETSASFVTVAITSPADACIGQYVLTANAGPSLITAKFIMLFNPWCAGDWVYLPQENERQEYVMNELGQVYQGNVNLISPMTWDFGQFEDDIIDICLKLLDVNPKCQRNAGKDFSARCNPIYVSRVVSAMINANDDLGVLVGRWVEPMNGGVHPCKWNSSVEILRRWFRSNCVPVKYGQCWVFAAVMCTVLRCLGIPSRVVTNFNSAHDTNGNLIVDSYKSYDGSSIAKESSDSIWNFHVWVEGWMKRPDLSDDSFYDGWQVLDATPQEKSEGAFCCGPAPVKAVLEGHTEVKYDIPFVFAEVNADCVTWLVKKDGSKIQAYLETSSVGQCISTKAVGSDRRADITNTYKYPEGLQKERNVFKEAVARCNMKLLESSPLNCMPRDISLNVGELSQPINGMDVDLRVALCSPDTKPRELLITVTSQVMRYTGVPVTTISSQEKKMLMSATEQDFNVQIPFSNYVDHMKENNTIKVTAFVKDSKNEVLAIAERDVMLENPPFTVTTIGSPVLYKEMMAEMIFQNPLTRVLKDCQVTITGSGLLENPGKFLLPSLKPGCRSKTQFYFKPYRAGFRKLMVNFSCDVFRNIEATCSVDVKTL